jgi:DNA polymerase I-like protein with 3'-5' exonuclease and polymerase domains
LWRTGLPFNEKDLKQLIEDLDIEHYEVGEKFIEDFDAALPEGHKLCRGLDGKLLYQTKPGAKGKKPDPNVFNLNSPAQLLKKFTALLGEPPMDTKNNKPSASRSALQEYVGDHHVVADYLRWKKIEKRRQMAETLLKNLRPDGYIKASYLQLGADTGRMSCISPNLQQLPRDPRFRLCVKAPEGYKFVVADYAQMELRLAAAEAQDSLMIQAFQEGQDLHTLTAMRIYGVSEDEVTKEQRQVAKSCNFGLLYGSGAKGLRNYAAAMGIGMDLDEAAEVRQKFHAAYKGISSWQRKNAAAADAAKGNPAIFTRVSNFRRFLPGENNRLTTRCNNPIQSAGAAVLKLTLGKLWSLLKQDGEDVVRLAGVVHDEVICLVAEEHAERWAKLLSSVMEECEAKWLGDIPAAADANVGDTWYDAK